jgi:hypothetical protein
LVQSGKQSHFSGQIFRKVGFNYAKTDIIITKTGRKFQNQDVVLSQTQPCENPFEFAKESIGDTKYQTEGIFVSVVWSQHISFKTINLHSPEWRHQTNFKQVKGEDFPKKILFPKKK